MYVKFWGTRGSIPAPLSTTELRTKIRQALKGAAGLNLRDDAMLDRYLERLPFPVGSTIGGNTPCIEVRSEDQLLIIDAGSGIRLLGIDLLQRGFAHGHREASILITHTHWDHINGFPFFRPAFMPYNRFTFYSPFADLAQRFNTQQQPDFFPVPLDYMNARLEFKVIAPNQWHNIGKFRVYPMRLSHPGETYGYRVEDGSASLVCATDSEYKRLDPASTEEYVHFFQDTGLLIFDAQYTLAEALDKADWGHSTPVMGAELARRAGAKRLALSHHDPTRNDEQVWAGKELAEAYLLRASRGLLGCEVLVAYDGMSLEI